MSELLPCRKCDTELDNHATTCLVCGTENRMMCAECNTLVTYGTATCGTCGFGLGPWEGDEGPKPPPMATADPDSAHQTKPLPTPDIAPPPLPDSAPPSPIKITVPRRFTTDQYGAILDECRDLVDTHCDLYGVFGRPASGKTCFIYALGKLIQEGSAPDGTIASYSLEQNWKDLIRFHEEFLEIGQSRATDMGLHFYRARSTVRSRRKRHFALLDIQGEQFEQITDWNHEVTDFFMTYLSHCKGFFMFLDMDEDIKGSKLAAVERREQELGPLTDGEKKLVGDLVQLKRNQMAQIVDFLSVAATVPAVKNVADYQKLKTALNQARKRERQIGARKLKVPVVLCISKADLMPDRKFEDCPRIVPGSDNYFGDPWNVLEEFWPRHMESLKQLVPHLKVEWVSSLGENYDPKRGEVKPKGLTSAFSYVVEQPPPPWAFSGLTYAKFRKYLL